MSREVFDFDATVWDLIRGGISVDLLAPTLREEGNTVAVRLRPWGKHLPKNKMILATGETYAEALEEAVAKALARRWEGLDWSQRPWARLPDETHGGPDAWGLL